MEAVLRRFSTGTLPYRRSQRQFISTNADTQAAINPNNPAIGLDTSQTPSSTTRINTVAALALPTNVSTSSSSTVSKSGAGNSNSLPGHQSSRSTLANPRLLDQKALNISDNLNSSSNASNYNTNNSPPTTLSRKKNLSTSDLDPSERKKQAALAKVEAKLEKAQRLYEKAQQSVEQEISDFLRVTTIPSANHEANSSRNTNASFDKRIRTLQDTKKELEKKIANYHTDISRIQAGDIPHNYSTSKDILSNIKSTAVKVASGSLKHRSSNSNDQNTTITTFHTAEPSATSSYNESDPHYHNPNVPTTSLLSSQPSTSSSTIINTTATITGVSNNNNNPSSASTNQYNSTMETSHSSVTSSATNEVGNSQFYIDSNYDHYDNDKSNRKHDTSIPVDSSAIHEIEKSPTTKRRLTDEIPIDSSDGTSNHSVDDRCTVSTSKRSTTNTTIEYQQLNAKFDAMQKLIDRYETRISDMQKQIDLLILSNENQRENTERLNNEMTDLTDLHQVEMAAVKLDLKNLEERLLYKFNDYWNELLERLDKLDTRTAKVEQTQTHSLETEENTHRIISKLVNIILTVFAIILLLLSTIKNLVQSRVHAMTILVLVFVWITFHYLPQNYFQTSFMKNVPAMFKRS